VAGLLEQLASPGIENLLSQLGGRRLALDPKVLDELLETAASAAAERDVPRALSKLSELVTLDPERGAALVNEALSGQSPLVSIHAEVEMLLQRLAISAKADAHQTLAAAFHAQDLAGPHQIRGGEPDPRIVLSIAERLADSGPHINYVRAEELGKFVVAYYDFAAPRTAGGKAVPTQPRGAIRTTPPRRANWIAQLLAMWRRAPLLLLLLAWFALGLAVGILTIIARTTGLASADSSVIALGFELWGLGFPALVGFGFYRSIRRLRR
jgi:hypothetical protein